jgi:hypothetical protein
MVYRDKFAIFKLLGRATVGLKPGQILKFSANQHVWFLGDPIQGRASGLVCLHRQPPGTPVIDLLSLPLRPDLPHRPDVQSLCLFQSFLV